MRTRNILVSATLLISGLLSVNGVFATTPTTSDQVKLNIVLMPIQTITVNPTGDDVNIVYATEKHYEEGVSKVKEKHLKVFSTGGFQVKVKSGEFLSNGTTNINASDVTVLATPSVSDKGENTVTSAVALGSEQTLITSSTGGRNLEYDVTYNNEIGNDKYINLYDKDDTNTFTTTVSYTIAAN